MADDAAGAVRRTPRPAQVPELWWSPAACMVYADREGAGPRYLQMRDTKHFPLPADAVQLVGPDQRRQVVLLRAEDCACPVGEDCPHGPEPVDALDLAVWLHAELQHKLTLPCGECHACMNWADETWRRADRKPPTVGRWEEQLAETRNLHARLDDAIKLIEEMSNHLRQDPALTIGVETRLAALRADEAAEPETGCMDGPAKQHTLHMVGIIKALKSAAGMDQLPLEPPSRDNFVRLARAIADYWPRGIDRPPAEPTGEADRG